MYISQMCIYMYIFINAYIFVCIYIFIMNYKCPYFVWKQKIFKKVNQSLLFGWTEYVRQKE